VNRPEAAQSVEPHTPELSIIVPTYQEAENLRPLVTRLAAAMSSCDGAYEIIVVDDDSQDGSDARIEGLAGEGHPVRLITRVGERGLSSAVIRGFREARGRTLVCMDADLSHPPEAVGRLVECLDDPAVDFVIGSRYVPGASTDEDWGVLRWINSKVATLLARPFTRARDPMAGFFALPRAVFERAAPLSPVGYKIGLELIVKCACRQVREVPIHFADRQFGQSKLTLREQLNYLKHLKRLADYKFGVLSRLVQFCVVGGTGLLVDLACYGLLLGANVPIHLARALAIWVAMTWNFFLNRSITFRHSRADTILVQYARFVLTCSLGAVVSWSVNLALVKSMAFFDRHLFIAALVGVFFGTLCNFLISLKWVFRSAAPGRVAVGREDG